MLKNIIILNDYAHIQGGASQVAVTSAIGLAKAGLSVTFIHATAEVDSSLAMNGVQCISLNQFDLMGNPGKLAAFKDGMWNIEVYSRILTILQTYNPIDTVVHIHSWVKALSISALAAVRDSGLSCVLTLHDYFPICPNGGFYNYKTENICTKKPLSLNCLCTNCDSRSYTHKLWRFARQTIYRHANFPEFIKNFISVSDFSESILKPGLPVDSTIWRVPNPIEAEHTPPANPEKSKFFTFIGRLSPEKGALILSKLKKIPDSRFRFIGSGLLEPELKALMPNAEFRGWCDRKTILELLDDTRALVFTSNLYETQGMVVAEAASRGVPSVVSSNTAAKEFIQDGVTGLLYNTGDAQSLEEKFSVLDDNELVKNLGINSYEKFWEKPPTIEVHISSLINCYSSILGGR